MASELCTTCGLPLAGHVCPVLPEGVIRRGTALIKPIEMRKVEECPHCGRLGGHNNDGAHIDAFRCSWISYSVAKGLMERGQRPERFAPYSLDELEAFVAWARSSGLTWKATPPRV